ncbi:MAG TPA: TonB-dependent receptor plug domain-containing protein, partial [Chitinophagaceae bacterium]|nr:TonB-dependent receptor plug domain-containing protein [Chitinophagaceae bacterium]
ALYGKAAGVRINSAPGGATSAVNVQIRGISSINGNTQPLYVVDGIPIRLYNNIYGNGDANANNAGYYSESRIQSNGVLDINPDDIESLTILKGASASALYGSEATNGVVVITTKKGSKGKGLGVDLNYVVNQEKLAFSPDYQNEYGPGYDKITNLAYGTADGWIVDADGSRHPRYRDYGQFGPKFDGSTIRNWDGTMIPYVAQPNNYKDFFQTGYNSNANLAVSGAGDKGSFRLSYTRMDYKGIQPGGKLGKNSFSFNSTLKLNDRVSVDIVSSYVNSLTHNRPTLMSRVFGAYDGFFSRMDNMGTIFNKYQTTKGYKYVQYNQPYDDQEKLYYNYRPVELLNLLWNQLKNSYDESQDRFINSATLNVGILSNLKFRGRVGGDFTSLNIEDKQYSEYPSSFGYTGKYGIQSSRYNIFYGDALLTYNNKITKDLDYTVTAGFTGRKQVYRYQKAYTKDGLISENFFSLSNSANTSYTQNEVNSKRAEDVYVAEFGTLGLSYKNFLFVEGTARNEATSTLPPGHNSYFYPSVNSGFVFSDVVKMPDFVN